VLTILMGLFFYSERMVHFFEDILYQDEIVYAEDTPYQRIILTRWRNDIRLFLNGHIQFSSIDEARYHESLVHPALVGLGRDAERILILGGGDGLAVREILKWSSVEQIDLVDIDPAITELGRNHPMLTKLNENALQSDIVTVTHQDAMLYLQESETFYDVVYIDLPDPNSETLSKLYSTSFYELVHRRLTSDGILVTQATSPYFAPEAFWCIEETLTETFTAHNGTVYPYHINVPSFGEWGFVMASKREMDWSDKSLKIETKFLTTEKIPTLFVFGQDIAKDRVDIESNHLLNPVLFHYYKRGWQRYNQ
jgi:spermidine synthase